MELITTYICKEFDLGIHSNMFGGRLMALLDDAAAGYAAQLCDSPMIVTIKFDEFVFKKPVKVGSILKIYGKVVKFGNTSITVCCDVRNKNTKQSIIKIDEIVFVLLDENGKPKPHGKGKK